MRAPARSAFCLLLAAVLGPAMARAQEAGDTPPEPAKEPAPLAL